MRDAEHGKDGAPVALEVSLTLFPAWLQSVPLRRGALPPITILGAIGRGVRLAGEAFCLWGAPFSPTRGFWVRHEG